MNRPSRIRDSKVRSAAASVTGLNAQSLAGADSRMSLTAALLTVRQMAEADRLSIAAGVSEFELMANAGACVADAIMARWPVRPLLVLCGPGNNGGDGFVAAQRLADAGWPVRVGMLGGRRDSKGSAHRHAERWHGHVEALDIPVLEGAELIVDALFGAGLSRPLSGLVRDTLAAAAAGTATIIAIDMPSGVMGDTGEVIGAVPMALTITFSARSPATCCCRPAISAVRWWWPISGRHWPY
jgi:hydroxyethylthiazole kinase-like uncharacterized protein yjeF